MDRNFLKRLREKKESAVILIILALGLILLFLGSYEKKAEPEAGLEARISEACSGVEGVGECCVYIYYSGDSSRTESDSVESVLVVCEGADSVDVRLRLTEMLSSFFGIGSNRIRIEKMKR